MKIEYDPNKRDATLQARGLDFEDIRHVLAGDTVLLQQDRRNPYPEARFNALGMLQEQLVHFTFCLRDEAIRVISMRPASRKEKAYYEEQQTHR